MKTKRMNRYYCDFCKKAGCSASCMSRHEKACCGNPKRQCGMCKSISEDEKIQKPIDELIGALRSGGVNLLRETANGCPVCMLAAIIQHRKQIGPNQDEEDWYFREQFDFKKERDETWAKINVRRELGYKPSEIAAQA